MSDHREWRRQLAGLSDTFTVVAWDAPGTGVSGDPASVVVATLLTDRATGEMVEELVGIIADARPSGARPMLCAMAEADLRPVLPTIRVPTLLLYGEDDARSPRAVAEGMHRAIARSELVFLPRVGHQSNIETADRFNDEVRRFLRAAG
jgi:pimeloyl-ACP methyl ester carboxylesterase